MFRIEIYLPVFYNDGQRIEPEKFDITRKEILRKFRGLTALPRLRGWWIDKGHTYEDEVVIYRVDCEDKNEKFWEKYKAVLKRRFRQTEIYISINEVFVI